ncbi:MULTISPECIES: hypothetical protein [unclassified Serratia (in: enterobacteria)]|uniref:hypothetical protein n=1 Tax=unclassified Serratia (in: enterobacteria) TaxID=2647522 RepID=UPI0027E5E371|nr:MULTISPECIES: hypothetical protein [unclassified Serratia (in: enterobacteria)]MDQ7101906.1 hypothetical protein [Serratia sp. MF2]MDQ7104482.1 hypothetical protein [Serratia sp. MF1(2023)]
MLKNEELQNIEETDHVQCGDAATMARELLAWRGINPPAPIIKSSDSDPQREFFTCKPLNTDSGEFYIINLGSVPGRELSLYRNEAESLYLSLRDALSIKEEGNGNS